MRHWQILDADDQVVAYRVDGDSAPDPASYGGVQAVALSGAVDPFEQDLASLTALLLAQIDRDCGAFRARFITDVTGQDMTYLRKEMLARSWTPEADQAGFSILAGEAALRGITTAEQVALVIAMADQWAAIGDPIEVRRMAAKLAVEAAATADDKKAAVAIDWEALLG